LLTVDAGGGTVDFAAHEVEEPITHENCGKIVELYHASGGGWGSTRLDQEFCKLLREMCGDEAIDGVQFAHESKTGESHIWTDMIQQWESHKEHYDSKLDKLIVRLPDSFIDALPFSVRFGAFVSFLLLPA
jgi:hypothetical protein